MSQFVEISFDCVPLRSVARFDVPLDAPEETAALYERMRSAVTKHGVHNAFFLCNARCVFHFANHPTLGMVAFRFEGTALTDAEDQVTIACDLTTIEMDGETCDWLTAQAVKWLRATVAESVRIEFNRYIAAGDLQKTVERIERLEKETESRGGFLGMGL